MLKLTEEERRKGGNIIIHSVRYLISRLIITT